MPDDDTQENDAELFRSSMSDVEPLPQDRAPGWKPRPKPVPRPQTDGDDIEFVDIRGREVPAFLEFRRPGIQDRVYRDLSRGVIDCEASLDLHGMRVSEARQALSRFMRQSLSSGKRCVRIVHGKGYRSEGQQPVLKQCVNQWLQQRKEVLAFCTAPRWDGGTGAVYALLSRKFRRSS